MVPKTAFTLARDDPGFAIICISPTFSYTPPMTHCKIYASDEGFGHLVRQQAVADALTRLVPEIQFDLQTQNHADTASWLFPEATLIRRFNNIRWPRDADGSPDLSATKQFLSDYQTRSKTFINEESDQQDYDFLLSDFVYEAFPIGRQRGIPAFGICHFTWDWFFSKLYPLPITTQVLDYMQSLAWQAERLFFSEFSPPDLIAHYHAKAIVHPLIVRQRDTPKIVHTDRFKVLIMDSGANVLTQSIEDAVKQVHRLPDIQFFIHNNFALEADNVTLIPDNVPIVDYLKDMDLVISRGGFNTIAECIAWRVPLLLIGEARNPEMERNLFCIKQQDLGSFVSLQRFRNQFADTLQRFIDGEYLHIKNQTQNHDIRTDGADVVAKAIVDIL
jgi:uncharacterized protein (TIGR00661 family)